MIHLADATIEHLQERYDALEAFYQKNAETYGEGEFPIHDAYSADDPDAEWNDMWAIGEEIDSRW